MAAQVRIQSGVTDLQEATVLRATFDRSGMHIKQIAAIARHAACSVHVHALTTLLVTALLSCGCVQSLSIASSDGRILSRPDKALSAS